MIDLQIKGSFEGILEPFVVRIRVGGSDGEKSSDDDALAVRSASRGGSYQCNSRYGAFSLIVHDEQIDGDVILCIPAKNVAQRLFRRSSKHNTLLLTERCDQLCVMCSQPPRRSNDEWRFPLFERALSLVDRDVVIGISGGEPTLYKRPLFEMLSRISEKRGDLTFHILSNAQHFEAVDVDALQTLHKQCKVLWGIPLYSHRPDTHDEIVGKRGAFEKLMQSLFLLGASGANIEVRTVITSLNVFDLPHLASFVANHIPFLKFWAIMGMEPIGYAKPNWSRLFFDHSAFPQPIVNAIEVSRVRKIPLRLYNIPRCTLPARYRDWCVDSISDWKKKYLPACTHCVEKGLCAGFFEWYDQKSAWSKIEPILEGRALQ